MLTGGDLGVGPADEDGVGAIVLDHAERFAEREQAADFALRDRVVRPLGVVEDRDVAGRHVGDVGQHPGRRHVRHADFPPAAQIDAGPIVAGAQERCLPHLREIAGERRRAEDDAEPGRLEGRVRVGDGELGGGDGEVHGPHHLVEPLAFLLVEELSGVEVENLGPDLDGKAGRIEGPQPGDAGPALAQTVPERLERVAERRDQADSGDDDPTTRFHGRLKRKTMEHESPLIFANPTIADDADFGLVRIREDQRSCSCPIASSPLRAFVRRGPIRAAACA